MHALTTNWLALHVEHGTHGHSRPVHRIGALRMHGLQSSGEVDAAEAVVRFVGQAVHALVPGDSLYAPAGHGKHAASGFPAIAAEP